ncbi:hypothetical protein ACWCYZ_16795 [Streptomyces virginiae]
MNGWTWAGIALAVQIIGAYLMSLALRRGERQPRAGRHAPIRYPSWARPAPRRRRHRR